MNGGVEFLRHRRSVPVGHAGRRWFLQRGQYPFAKRFLVAFNHRDALLREGSQRFLLYREAMGARVYGRLFRRIEKALAQLHIHAVEGGIAEVDRQRREIMLRQRVVLRGFVELAGEDGWRVMFEPVEYASLQRGIDFAKRQRRCGRAHQAKTFGDDWIGQRADLQPCQVLRRLHRLLCEHAAGAEIIRPGDDPDIGAL